MNVCNLTDVSYFTILLIYTYHLNRLIYGFVSVSLGLADNLKESKCVKSKKSTGIS